MPECLHKDTEIRYVLAKNNQKMFVIQCLVCGELASSWLKTKTILNPEEILPLDEKLREEQGKLKDIERRKEYEKKHERWREFYYAYLQSSEWHEKTVLVRQRCFNFCERCGVMKVDAIHHLSYKNLGHESLDELLGVCEHCHAKLHRRVER